MLKRIVTALALCAILSSRTAHAQREAQPNDSITYQSKKLKKEDINFVTGYYTQNGNNAAVTGGKGDEQLTDVSTTFNLNLGRYDKKLRKHSIKLDLGIDVYSSASSDKIDANTVSSASKSDSRIYPSVNYSIQDDSKGYNVGGGLSYSREYDYTSYGSNVRLSKWSNDHNREITAKVSIYMDEWKVILPADLRPPGYGSGSKDDKQLVDYKPRNSYNIGWVLSQVINRNLQVALLTDFVYQEGLLATKFHRVFFTNNEVRTENLPDSRIKVPLGIRGNYFAGDNVVIRGYYRYYIDTWDVQAHTASLELSYKFTPFFSLAPSYRYYTQTAAKYFAPYKSHLAEEVYYTSDYDLSQFHSHMFGLNARFSNLSDKFFLSKLNTLEIRYGYYQRSTGLDAHSITFALNLK